MYVLKSGISGAYWATSGAWVIRQKDAAKLELHNGRFYLAGKEKTSENEVSILSSDVVVKLRKKDPVLAAIAKAPIGHETPKEALAAAEGEQAVREGRVVGSDVVLRDLLNRAASENAILRRHIRTVRNRANGGHSHSVGNQFDNSIERLFDTMDRELIAKGFSL